MKLRTLLMCAVAGLGIAAALAPSNAFAAAGWSAKNMNLRAGPDRDYPVIARLPANALLQINGCVGGYAWCDVSWRGMRGWVLGKNLETDYRHRKVFIVNQGPAIGLPLITFDIGSYWDDYYRNRPFYADRPHYAEVHHLNWHDDRRDRDDHRNDHDNHDNGNHNGPNNNNNNHRWHGPHDPDWNPNH